MKCEKCEKAATQSYRKDPFGKTDEWGHLCMDHATHGWIGHGFLMATNGAYYDARDRIRELEGALRKIQQWDCLNPPRTDLFSDAIWLRKVVDDALTPVDGETK